MGIAIRLPRLKSAPADKAEAKRKRKTADTRGVQQARSKQAPSKRKPRAQQAKGATRKVAREADKPKRNYSWLNRIIILLGAGVVLIAASQAYITLQAIPVERITVTGELEHTQTAAVQDMVYPALSGGFLWADLARVREQLEALPWIHEATVRRVWPNALEINVVEQLPIARWGDEAFLNHGGEIFRPSKREAWQTLPLLRGPDDAAQTLMLTYQRLVDLLKPLGLSLAQLTIDERGEVAAVLGGGQQLVIGGVDFLERMKRFKAVYRTELASQMDEVERIDLRYERGVAVGFREPAEVSAEISDNEKA